MDIKTPRKGPVSFEVSPVITITIPGAQLVSFVGNAAYREDRSLLAEFSLDIPSLMDKASFKCKPFSFSKAVYIYICQTFNSEDSKKKSLSRAK